MMCEEITKLKEQINEMAMFLARYGVDTKHLSQLMHNIDLQVSKRDEFYKELRKKLGKPIVESEVKPIDFDLFAFKYKEMLKRAITTLGIIKQKHPWFDFATVLDGLNNIDIKNLWSQTKVVAEHRIIEKNRTYRIQYGEKYCLFYVRGIDGASVTVEDQQTKKQHKLNRKLFMEKLDSGIITVAA